jgi:DNA-3-methyladenine glycosylase
MRLKKDFFKQDALEVAPKLLGKVLVRRFDDSSEVRYTITETEAYRGEEDLACHASKGRTERTKALYEEGGIIYVYLIYGMHWMLNVVAGRKDFPSGVLIRGLDNAKGSGRVGKLLKIDKSFYGEDITKSQRLWIEEPRNKDKITYTAAKRVGVEYAGKWCDKLWRFIVSF